MTNEELNDLLTTYRRLVGMAVKIVRAPPYNADVDDDDIETAALTIHGTEVTLHWFSRGYDDNYMSDRSFPAVLLMQSEEALDAWVALQTAKAEERRRQDAERYKAETEARERELFRRLKAKYDRDA